MSEFPRRLHHSGGSETPERRAPTSLHTKAVSDLARIRAAMDGATRFTGVSGWGEMLIGATALVATAVARLQPTPERWLLVWLAAVPVAVLLGTGGMVVKARGRLRRLMIAPARRFGLGLLPPLVAGLLLTLLLVRLGQMEHLPGLWLLLYGVAVTGAGTFSVPAVPVMGLSFMALSAAALVTPSSWGDAWMAIGFGGLHLLFGALIWRRHGG